jgi:hypothetical protein
MEIGDDFLPELDFDFEEQEDDTVIDDKVVNDEIPEDEDDSPDDDCHVIFLRPLTLVIISDTWRQLLRRSGASCCIAMRPPARNRRSVGRAHP